MLYDALLLQQVIILVYCWLAVLAAHIILTTAILTSTVCLFMCYYDCRVGKLMMVCCAADHSPHTTACLSRTSSMKTANEV